MLAGQAPVTRRMNRLLASWLVPLLAATSGAAQGEGAAARAAAWAADLAAIDEAISAWHPAPYRGVSPGDLHGAFDALRTAVADLTDDQIVVELMRSMALLSRQGRDGHSGVWPRSFRRLPVQLYEFCDGLFVVQASAEHRDLVGAEVVGFGPSNLVAVREAIDALVCHDSEWDLRVKRTALMLMPQVLVALQLVPNTELVTLHVRRGNGAPSAIELRSQTTAEYAKWNKAQGGTLPEADEPRYLANRGRAYGVDYLSRERVLYVQYNAVVGRDAAGKSIAEFAREVRGEVDMRQPAALVVDVRHNGGGSNTTYGPLLRLLQEVDANVALYVLIGRHTFSAASNFVTDTEKRTRAVLAGEPTGGSPNQYGDARTVRLAHHPDLLVRVSTRYHQKSRPDDERLTHDPALRVELTSSDYFAKRDPVLAAVSNRHR